MKSRDIGTLGVSWTRLDLGTQTRTTEGGSLIGEEHSIEQAVAITYAEDLGDISIGVTGKWINSSLASLGAGLETPGSMSGLALDIGVLVRGLFPQMTLTGPSHGEQKSGRERFVSLDRQLHGISLGMGAFNLGSDLEGPDFSDPLPRHLRVGIAYAPITYGELESVAALDVYWPLIGNGNSPDRGGREFDIHVGAEMSWADWFAGRCGWHSDKDGGVEGSSWGIGIGPETFRLDFRRYDYGSYDDSIWSLSIVF